MCSRMPVHLVDIYLIIVFVIIAISSCIGACIRHRRHQLYVEQLNNRTVTITAGNPAVNQGPYITRALYLPLIDSPQHHFSYKS